MSRVAGFFGSWGATAEEALAGWCLRKSVRDSDSDSESGRESVSDSVD